MYRPKERKTIDITRRNDQNFVWVDSFNVTTKTTVVNLSMDKCVHG